MQKETALLSVTLFGNFAVVYNGDIISSLSARAENTWKLFRYLLAHNGAYVSSDALIELLFDSETVPNPRKALQNLVYRLRKMLPAMDSQGEPYILSKHYTYSWNDKAEINVDAQEFSKLVLAIKSNVSGFAIEAAASRINALYTGEYMEPFLHEDWVKPFSLQFRTEYFDCMNIFASLLYKQGKYAEVMEICATVLKHDIFEQHFHALLINSMLAQGNRYSALTHYRSIVSLLQSELDATPSEELRSAGKSISSISQPMRPDIQVVMEDLRSAAAAAGPMFCEIDVFRQIFQLYDRMNHRGDFPCVIVMYTIAAQDRILGDQAMFHVMNALKRSCAMALRRSDVVSQHSNTQLLLLLPNADEISISNVLMRIQKKFAQLCLEQDVYLVTQIRSMLIPKTE